MRLHFEAAARQSSTGLPSTHGSGVYLRSSIAFWPQALLRSDGDHIRLFSSLAPNAGRGQCAVGARGLHTSLTDVAGALHRSTRWLWLAGRLVIVLQSHGCGPGLGRHFNLMPFSVRVECFPVIGDCEVARRDWPQVWCATAVVLPSHGALSGRWSTSGGQCQHGKQGTL
jgi:hypothetical protein